MNCKFPPELCTVARCSVQASRIAAVVSLCGHAQCIVALVVAGFARATLSVVLLLLLSKVWSTSNAWLCAHVNCIGTLKFFVAPHHGFRLIDGTA